jgi:hypothetical protein
LQRGTGGLFARLRKRHFDLIFNVQVEGVPIVRVSDFPQGLQK